MNTPISQQRAHQAWRKRLLDSGGAYMTLPLSASEVNNLDLLRRGEESRPQCVQRLIREAYASRC